jgi:hypothetical protein
VDIVEKQSAIRIEGVESETERDLEKDAFD